MKWYYWLALVIVLIMVIVLVIYVTRPHKKQLRTLNGTTPDFYLDAEIEHSAISVGGAVSTWVEPDLSSTYTFTGSPRILMGPQGSRGVDLNFASTSVDISPTFPTTGDYTAVICGKGVSPQLFGWDGGGSNDGMHLGVTRSGDSDWDNALVYMPLAGDLVCLKGTATNYYDSGGTAGAGTVAYNTTNALYNCSTLILDDADSTNLRIDTDDASDIIGSIQNTGCIECWIRVDSTVGTNACYFCIDADDDTGTQNLLVLETNSTNVYLYIDNTQVLSGITRNVSTWEHWAVCWTNSPSDETRLYRNGILLHTEASKPTLSTSPNDRIYIAAQPDGTNPGYANSNYMSARYAQFKIWNSDKYTGSYFQVPDVLFRTSPTDASASNTLCYIPLEQNTTDEKGLTIGTTGTIQQNGPGLLGPPTTTLTDGKIEIDADDAGNLLGALGSSGTIEGYFYQKTDSTCLFTIGDESSYDPHLLGLYSSNDGNVYCMVNGNETKVAESFQASQWIHWAVTWDSTTTRVYRQGSQIGSNIGDKPAFVNTDHLMLGGEGDPYASSVEVIMPLVSDVTDYSGKSALTNTNNGVTFSSSQTLFNQNNSYTNGTNAWIGIDTGRVRVLNSIVNECTVECWAYHTRSSATECIFAINSDTHSPPTTATNRLLFYSEPSVIIQSSALLSSDERIYLSPMPLNTWFHIAVTWLNGVGTEAYMDGVSQGTLTNIPLITPGTDFIFVGAEDDDANSSPDGNWWQGYISNLRITGKRRYTTNFTPPQCPYINAYPSTSAMSHIRVSNTARYTDSTYTIPAVPYPMNNHYIQVSHNGSQTRQTTSLNAEDDYVVAVRRTGTSYTFDANVTKLSAVIESGSLGTVATSDSSLGDVYSSYGLGNSVIYAVAIYNMVLSDSDLYSAKSYLTNRFISTIPSVNYSGTVLGYIGYAITNKSLTVATGTPTAYDIDTTNELFNSSNAQWTGTPTTTQASSTFTVTATDAKGWYGTANITVEVRNTPSITYTDSIVEGNEGQIISITPVLVSMTSQTFSISPSLPSGLSFNTLTAAVSGTSTSSLELTSFTVSTTHLDLSVEFKDTFQMRVTASVNNTDSGTTESTTEYDLEYEKAYELFVGSVRIEPTQYSGYDTFTVSDDRFIVDGEGVITGSFIEASPLLIITITATGGGNTSVHSLVIQILAQILYNDDNILQIELDQPIRYEPKLDGLQTSDRYALDKSFPKGLQLDQSTGAITGTLTDGLFKSGDFVISAQKGNLIGRGTVTLERAQKSSNNLVIILSACGGGLLLLAVVGYIVYRKYYRN
jgi:hypothetical protein